jgi:hypothetical protein
MRLSIAIAAETKSTPQDRRRYYLDTTDQVSRFIRKLRKADIDSRPDAQEWIQVRALRLCQVLQDIITELE